MEMSYALLVLQVSMSRMEVVSLALWLLVQVVPLAAAHLAYLAIISVVVAV